MDRKPADTLTDHQLYEEILTACPQHVLQEAVNTYSFQRVFYCRRRGFVAKYFEGSELKFSIRVNAIFRQKFSVADEIRAKELALEYDRIRPIAVSRALSMPMKAKHRTRINEIARELKEVTAGLNQVVKDWKRLQKKKTRLPEPQSR